MEIGSIELTAATAVVSTGIAAFSTFCPPMSHIMKDHGSEEMRQLLGFGQNAGAVATLSVGVVLSLVTKSPVPLLVSIGIGLLIVFAYEFAFRKDVD